MNNEQLFFCPACDGVGSFNGYTNPENETLCRDCAGDGFVDAATVDLFDLDARPYTPSRRRWHGWRGGVTMADPLIYLAAKRAAFAARKTYGMRCEYESACRLIGTVGAHTYAGLMQAQMLARATIVDSAWGRMFPGVSESLDGLGIRS